MTTIIVVEPNALLRLGILQLFQTLAAEVTCHGMDYTQLVSPGAGEQSTDLMMLSAPRTYERTAELIQAGQKSYNPRRILLLSEGATPTFALSHLSPKLAGYISKHTPIATLTAAINLVLAGGTCFPNPDGHGFLHPPITSGDPERHRRWYDQPATRPAPAAQDIDTHTEPTPLMRAPLQAMTPEMRHTAAALRAPPASASASLAATAAGHKAPAVAEELAAAEARMLKLTARQYEVLVLLAHGYPIKNVSRELSISISTAKTHADTLYQRLSVHNSLAAVYEALTRGATLGLSQKSLATISAAEPPAPEAGDPERPAA